MPAQVQPAGLHRLAGGRAVPGVDHHLLRAVQVGQQRRHGLGHIRAGQHHHVGLVQVGDRERQAPVHAERPVARRGGRRHAEPAVVVHLRGAQRHPGELAEQVGLLVGQPPAAENGHRVRPVRRAQPGEPARDMVQRVVPGHRRTVQQGGGEPLRVVQQRSGSPSLLTQPAGVGGELPRRHARRARARWARARRARHRHGHAALQSAVRAVRIGPYGHPSMLAAVDDGVVTAALPACSGTLTGFRSAR